MTATPLDACALTGASGYVGSILLQALRQSRPVVALSRTPKSEDEIAWSLQSSHNVASQLRERKVKILIHAAWDMQASNLADVERVCVRGSARLFEQAAEAGVDRIIFISTISAFKGCRSAYGRGKLQVESMLRNSYHTVLRLGLVFGDQPGGVFGSLRTQIQQRHLLPLIGSGLVPQYLLHQNTLSETVLRAANGDFDALRAAPITFAHPRPWPFRDLLQAIATREGRNIRLLPIPWPLLYAGVCTAEAFNLRLPFRSDSIISFVYSDRHPDFSALQRLNIDPIPFCP